MRPFSPLILISIALWGSSAGLALAAGPPAPTAEPEGVAPKFDLRFFLRQGPAIYFAEAAFTSRAEGGLQRSFTLGGYYRLFPNLRIGAFYRRAYGLRHDADWVFGGGRWFWADTSSRGEDFGILDATPRVQLEFLPGESWVGELKTRLLLNTFNGQNTFTARPGLTYFWLKDDEPFLNFFLQYELSFPLNYGVRTIYERWLYLGALYNLSENLDVGAYAAMKWYTAGNTQEFINLGGSPYAVTTQSDLIGFLAIVQF